MTSVIKGGVRPSPSEGSVSPPQGGSGVPTALPEALAEIERLQRENAELRESLLAALKRTQIGEPTP
jgi:hypothetical protein